MKEFKKAPLPLIGILSAILFFAIVAWKVPKWQAQQITNSSEKRLEIENAARSTLLQALGGLFFFVTAYFTWRSLKVSEGKEITGRLSKAIEMLSDEKTYTRLGGIYILERMVRDSSEDHWAVMKLLCSYIRMRSSSNESKKGTETKVSEDIQSAFEVIINRNIANDTQSLKNRLLDLREVDLSGIEINSVNLSYLRLEGSNLNNSSLHSVKFPKHGEGALHEVSLKNSDLRSADISEACIFEIDFSRSDLSEASFKNSTLQKINLSKCKLWGTNFIFFGSLEDVNLRGATYTQKTVFPKDFDPKEYQMYLIQPGSILAGLDLSNLDFRVAELQGANLSGSNLSGCNFKYAKLLKANLSNAMLNGADFYGAVLKDIIWNENTNWFNAKNLDNAEEIPDQLREELKLANAQTHPNNPAGAD